MNKLILVFFCPIICFSQTAIDTSLMLSELEEIIISATKSEKALDKLPIPTTIISSTEIYESGAVTLDDILEEQTGIITTTNYIGGEGVQLQGLDPSYTLILVDGLPIIGRSAGILDLKRISVNDIEKIEIVRGASSSLYGSEAIGGVINIITKENKKIGFNSDISLKLASYNTLNSSINIKYKTNKFQIGNSFHFIQSDGYDLNENDDYQTVTPFYNFTLSNNIKYFISEKINIESKVSLFQEQQEETGIYNSETLDGNNNQENFTTYLIIKHLISENIKHELDYYFTNYKTQQFLDFQNGESFSDSYFNQKLRKSEYKFIYNKNKNNVILGMGINNESLDRTDFSIIPNNTSTYSFLQFDIGIRDKINLITGSRYDYYKIYSSQFSNKVALSYFISKNTTIKSSVGTGYKTPDFRQLYFDFANSTNGYTVLGSIIAKDRITFLDNNGEIQELFYPIDHIGTSLDSENSLNINLGITHKIHTKINLDVNFFKNDIYNLIEPKLIANRNNGNSIFSYFNVSEVQTKGLESNIDIKFTNNLSFNVGYQLLFSEDVDAINKIKNGDVFALDVENGSFKLSEDDYYSLFNRSRHTANAKIYYSIPSKKLSLNLRTTYRSKFALFDSNGNSILDKYDEFISGYFILNSGVTKTFYNTSVQIGINNILNYSNVNYLSHISGRNYFINLNIKLNKKQKK